jgi:hypothetical protein
MVSVTPNLLPSHSKGIIRFAGTGFPAGCLAVSGRMFDKARSQRRPVSAVQPFIFSDRTIATSSKQSHVHPPGIRPPTACATACFKPFILVIFEPLVPPYNTDRQTIVRTLACANTLKWTALVSKPISQCSVCMLPSVRKRRYRPQLVSIQLNCSHITVLAHRAHCRPSLQS